MEKVEPHKSSGEDSGFILIDTSESTDPKKDGPEKFYSKEYFETLKEMLVEERKKRMEEIEKTHRFVMIVQEMKKDYENRLKEKMEIIHRRTPSGNLSPSVTRNERPMGGLLMYRGGGGGSQSGSFSEVENKRIADLELKIEEQKIVNDSTEKSLRIKNDLIRRQENELENLGNEKERLVSENGELKQLSDVLNKENKRILKELELANEKCEEKDERMEEYKKKVEKWIREKKEVLENKDRIVMQLTNKLIAMKQDLEKKNMQWSEYEVISLIKKGSKKEVKRKEARMRIKKSGIEILVGKKTRTIEISEISRVYFGKEEDLFIIEYGEIVAKFESPQREEIVEIIRKSIQYI